MARTTTARELLRKQLQQSLGGLVVGRTTDPNPNPEPRTRHIAYPYVPTWTPSTSWHLGRPKPLEQHRKLT